MERLMVKLHLSLKMAHFIKEILMIIKPKAKENFSQPLKLTKESLKIINFTEMAS
jgi:hypothetical protein